MTAYIKGISYYLPEEVLDNTKLNNEFPEWSVDKISSKTGIFKRHLSGKDEFSSDMAMKAAIKLFEEYTISPKDIDFVLLCTQSPDYFLPTTACIIQDKLGIPTTAGALDFNLGCSGYIYGLALAKGLISGNIAKNILLITSETYSKFVHPKDKSNKTIFGDGASATLVSANEGFAEIFDFVLGTDGGGAENLIVKNGGCKNPTLSGTDVIDEFGNIRNDNNLFMNGSEILSFTTTSIPPHITETLYKHHLTLEQIDLFIFHQANKFILDRLRKKINIPEEKFYIYLENCGNTVSATIPIALKEAMHEKKAKGNILLSGFGVGYSWGSCIINIKKTNINGNTFTI
jgi:3-oxoacyl-[acyl-carrier-protein] synthase-3